MLTSHSGSLHLPYTDHSSIRLNLPAGTVAAVHTPRARSSVAPVEVLLEQALRHPIGAARLEEMAQPDDRVLIVCDDVSRPTPAHQLVPAIVDRLNHAGVPDHRIEILFALGTHRPMTEAEMRAKVGDEIFRRVACHNHDAFDAAALCDCGRSREGIRVRLNRLISDASIIVGVGEISPHIVAGYGGGAKILYPGVAGEETIADFHATFNLDAANSYGVCPSPARASINHLAEVVGLDFIVDCVLGEADQVHAVFAGSQCAVFDAGVAAALLVHGVPARRRYDVVVVSSYPHWRDFWQGCKGIFAGAGLTRPGGDIIVAAACPDGVAQTHPDYVRCVGTDARVLAAQVAARTCKDVISAAGALKLAQMRERYRISIVSDGLSADEIAAMGFEAHATLEDALHAVASRRGAIGEIGVIPYGGQTFCYSERPPRTKRSRHEGSAHQQE